MPLRAMYVLPAENFGGAERQGVLHIAALPAHGVEVVAVVGPGERIRDELGAAGVSDFVFLDRMCTESHLRLHSFAKARWAVNFVRNVGETERALRRIATEQRVDVVVANRSWAWVGATRVARELGLPIVWRGGSRLTSAVETTALRAFAHLYPPDLVLANCEAVRADLAPNVPCETRILRNGVDVRRFDPERTAPSSRQGLGLSDDVPVVGFLARPAPEKGMDVFARVATAAIQALPSVRFLMAGEFGWRGHYQQTFAGLGLGEHVRFLGHVADVPGFLRSCDVVMLTSKPQSIEGSPNALLEAMAMCRPVVATRVGGVAEAVGDGVEGFLREHDDVPGLTDGLVRLLEDSLLRKRMGDAGRARVLACYRDDVVVEELATTLQAVVRSTRSRIESATLPHVARFAH